MAADNSRFCGHAKDKERAWQRQNGPSLEPLHYFITVMHCL